MSKGLIAAVALALAVFVVAPASAQTAAPGVEQAPPATDAKTLDTLVVTGTVSGPGMWRVYKDDQHALWILGTVKPLPANMQWDSASVRDMVGSAQEVLWYPSYAVNVKANLFQQAMLGFNYLRVRNNPDGKSLRQVLDPALYARWVAAKAKYLPRDSGVEDRRPIVAAQELLDAASKRAGLSSKYSFYEAMRPTMDAAGVRSTMPAFKVEISSAVAKAALADLRQRNLDDATCLAATLDALDTDLPRMVANANAWARGDVNSIHYATLTRRNTLCADALMTPEFSAKYGLPNIRESLANLWVNHARAALEKNETTVAFVPMEFLTGSNNLLDRLRAAGYTVVSP